MTAVTVSFVLRLVPERLLTGEIVGEVEFVTDGQHATVKDVEELRAFLVAAASKEVPDDIEQS